MPPSAFVRHRELRLRVRSLARREEVVARVVVDDQRQPADADVEVALRDVEHALALEGRGRVDERVARTDEEVAVARAGEPLGEQALPLEPVRGGTALAVVVVEVQADLADPSQHAITIAGQRREVAGEAARAAVLRAEGRERTDRGRRLPSGFARRRARPHRRAIP